jgi:photosystem II stability/assembly factor-like uncharacterized protein
MHRLLRLSFLMVLLSIIVFSNGYAQRPQAIAPGRIQPQDVRIFVKDTSYIISGDCVVGGTLIIEPGTDIYFYPNGRLIDSVGGRILADGYATSLYTPNPDGIVPLPSAPTNTLGFTGYNDLRYFYYRSASAQTVKFTTDREHTVNPQKYDIIFNVKLDTLTRRIKNLVAGSVLGPNEVIISAEEAIMFVLANLQIPDPAHNLYPYGTRINLAQAQIRFIGQPVNNISREWGHIIVLPGARSAFFRNVAFQGFRKDTTVDRNGLYNLTDANLNAIVNQRLVSLLNGAGGALTTFSARTWLIDATFTNNMARNRGGALQILDAKLLGLPATAPVNNFYIADKNPNITEKDGTFSFVNSNIPEIDRIDQPTTESLSDADRQSWDDARVAIFLGRVRNLTFTNNKVVLSNVGLTTIGFPPVQVVTDLLDQPANVPQSYGNFAYGGAMFISGTTPIEIGLGVNNSIRGEYLLNGNIVRDTIKFTKPDALDMTNNSANNYQPKNTQVMGARGGAIYVGNIPGFGMDPTSLIVAGKFDDNQTYTKFITDDATNTPEDVQSFSRGGAIYTYSAGRLQIRGGLDRNTISNNTEFVKNISFVGGAICIDFNTPFASQPTSPIIGGDDNKSLTADIAAYPRDYGFNILFSQNLGQIYGGAIYTTRKMNINGAGGIDGNSSMGYGDIRSVRFENNTSRYAGGAIDFDLTGLSLLLAPKSDRSTFIARAEFLGNTVGFDNNIAEVNKPFIRGGGAIYTIDHELNVVKATEFRANQVRNGNGGAIAMVRPNQTIRRFFLTDLDILNYNQGVAESFTEANSVFTFDPNSTVKADQGMLTRFLDNSIEVEPSVLASQSGTGTTQVGQGTIVKNINMNAVYFTDANNGFQVGDNGTIVKLTNGGKNWQYITSPVSKKLWDVKFLNSTTGYIVGEGNTLLKTVDGGITWTMINTIVDGSDYYDIDLNASKGVIVGTNGTILLCNDIINGTNWNVVSPKVTLNNLNAVNYLSADRIYICGDNGTVLVGSLNGNVYDWEVRPTNTLNNFETIYFTSQQVGYVAGSAGVILKTIDGGFTWNPVYQNVNGTDINSSFFTLNGAYFVGNNGLILKTIDAGVTFTTLPAATTKNIHDVYFPTSNTGYVVGDFEKYPGTFINTGLNGTTDAGASWFKIIPTDTAYVDVVRYHPTTTLQENGVGLGGAIYVIDEVSEARTIRQDSIRFDRVRIQNNKAFSGAAIYSDNFNLNLVFFRSLITGNAVLADNTIGLDQNAITGPFFKNTTTNQPNFASSDLAGAIIYGNAVGPVPTYHSPVASNSIYNNNARFLIRMPDAPNTKGILAGTTGIGDRGTDTLRGNYWGRTEANINLVLPSQPGYTGAIDETFFVDNYFYPKVADKRYLDFVYWTNLVPPTNLLTQGPFESVKLYNYQPIPLLNGTDENTPADNSINEKLLMSGLVYDLYDKGTDVRTVDYSARRMSPIEDFAVGIPPTLKLYATTNKPSNGHYIKRWLRDPEVAELRDAQNNLIYPLINQLQDEFMPDQNGNMYHPVGYPLFLETTADYSGLVELSNFDARLLNESVFFVINGTTGDYIRVNMKQITEDAKYGVPSAREIFRGRVELIPDSTNRLVDFVTGGLIRRIGEGLPTYGGISQILDSLYRNPYNEDLAVLEGRKYSADKSQFATVPDLFSNRPYPASNFNTATFFGGERYGALPVNVGDSIHIVSRTYLWENGKYEAINKGMTLVITGSTQPALYTGDIPKLQKSSILDIVPSQYPWKRDLGIPDTIYNTEFQNKIFVTEDRSYPAFKGTYSDHRSNFYFDPTDVNGVKQGRDSILAVTAVDTNNFYDPMSILFPGEYTNLTYKFSFDPNSPLVYWLWTHRVKSNQTQKDGALGYMEFDGHPINPFVVPNGDLVTVKVENYPPSIRTIDRLKDLSGLSADTISKFINLFKPYLNASFYDNINARFLQQDTINFGSDYTTTPYQFKVYVVNRPPTFLSHADPQIDSTVAIRVPDINFTKNQLINDGWIPDSTTIVVDTIHYISSLYTCDTLNNGMLKANLTDKLRFMADFNTTDEIEDFYAFNKGWDLRYGRTAYGFQNTAINNGDTITLDTDAKIAQAKPSWMQSKFMYTYGSENTPDTYGVDFTTAGKINIRIDRSTAIALLTPENRVNGALNTDTTFTIIADDGHGGLATLPLKVYVNVAPQIITQSLPDAIEDQDYNPELLDSTKMIHVYDPNFDQQHRFEIYNDNSAIPNPFYKDPCFSEAGTWDFTNLKKAPAWLKINPSSGLLYGTPRVKDAPVDNMSVTVICWDIIDGQDQLTDVKTYTMNVIANPHKPRFLTSPLVKCLSKGQAYLDTVLVDELDLERINPPNGGPLVTFNAQVLTPPNSSLTVTLKLKNSTQPGETDTLIINTNNFDLTPDPTDGRVTIKIRVWQTWNNVDYADTITYRMKVSDPADFISTIRVQNHIPPDYTPGAYKDLEWGTANRVGSSPTTGDGSDSYAIGSLDFNFCEYELPPIPPNDVFDARWTIPQTNGTTRDIYPRAVPASVGSYIFRAKFQAGGEVNGSSIYYPVTLTWDKSLIPAHVPNSNTPSWWIRDGVSNGQYFTYNMSTGIGEPASDIKVTGDTCQITITNSAIDGFVILYDWSSDAPNPTTYTSGIESIVPNPVVSSAAITFALNNNTRVALDIIDQLGNVVAQVTNAPYTAGEYTINWFNNLPSGTYTCRMVAGAVTSTYQLVIVK